VKKLKKTTSFIGNVNERGIDYGNTIEFVIEVTGEKNETLSDVLDEYVGKKVKISIEEMKKKVCPAHFFYSFRGFTAP
jgi:hypothetical protein